VRRTGGRNNHFRQSPTLLSAVFEIVWSVSGHRPSEAESRDDVQSGHKKNSRQGMALPCFSCPGSAHDERQHASVLKQAAATPQKMAGTRQAILSGNLPCFRIPFHGTFL